jgi:hypothetical protein
MDAPTKRTTIYLDNGLHKALRLKSIAVSKSVSNLVNEAVRDSLKRDKRNYNLVLETISKSLR